MTEQFRVYRAFISSPKDVAAERQLAEEAMQSMNRACAETVGATLMVRKWEDQPPETPHLPEEKIQDIINKEVEKAHFFILILFKRYGSVEPGHTKSNTEREIDAILKRYQSNPEIKILAYFREILSNDDPGDQENRITELRSRLDRIGIRHKDYKDPLAFKDAFTHDMYNVLLRMRLSPFKQHALRRFWKMGCVDGEANPRVAIIFSSVSREFMYPNDDGLWLRRLEPTVYYEDFRAIHKIQKTLSLIGLRHLSLYFSTTVPREVRRMNCVWICFPRSRKALASLEQYGTRVRFQLPYRKGVSSELTWRDSAGRQFSVMSPLASYLQEQRGHMDLAGEYTSHMRGIVCKDFAVVARFQNDKSADVTEEGFLYDYYFAGIRGLGTWGSAWYIDREPKKLLSHPEEGDIQLLLEVTYEDGAIADVADVSNKPPEYFLEQNQIEYIQHQIQLFND